MNAVLKNINDENTDSNENSNENSTSEKKIFAFTWCCDEGLDGFEEVFQAPSRTAVLSYMADRIREYVSWLKKHAKNSGSKMSRFDNGNLPYPPAEYEKGRNYCLRIRSTDWDKNATIGDFWNYMLYLTPDSLNDLINGTYVDGDSYFQIRLIEVQVSVML